MWGWVEGVEGVGEEAGGYALDWGKGVAGGLWWLVVGAWRK